MAKRSWNREDLAWAAGLFEGEGCFTKSMNVPVCSLGMTDEDVVRRFATIVGGGRIYQRDRTDSGHIKPMWQWFSITFEQSQATMVMLWPWLGDRRRARAHELFAEYRVKLAARERGDGTIAGGMFGKRLRDLTPDETRELTRMRTAESRRARGIPIRHMKNRSPEAIAAYQDQLAARARGEGTIAGEMFGKRSADLTPAEMREYRREITKRFRSKHGLANGH